MADYDVTAWGGKYEFATDYNSNNTSQLIDSTHVINFWNNGSGHSGYAQVFAIDGSGDVSKPDNSVIFAGNALQMTSGKLDDTHFINFWSDNDKANDAFCRVFSVNTGTWAITKEDSDYQYDTTASYQSCLVIDSEHVLNVWDGGGDDLGAQIFSVDPDTYEVATVGSLLEVSSTGVRHTSLVQLDSTHVMVFWQLVSDAKGYAQVLTINLSTWAVTAEDSPFEFDANYVASTSASFIDSTHVLLCWNGGASANGLAGVFEIDGSFAVTASNTPLETDSAQALFNFCTAVDNDNHFINFWSGSGSDGYVQVLTVNLVTWAVTAEGTALEFDTDDYAWNSVNKISNKQYISFYQGSSSDGMVRTFDVKLPTSLKTFNGLEMANVKTINGLSLTSIKTVNGLE